MIAFIVFFFCCHYLTWNDNNLNKYIIAGIVNTGLLWFSVYFMSILHVMFYVDMLEILFIHFINGKYKNTSLDTHYIIFYIKKIKQIHLLATCITIQSIFRLKQSQIMLRMCTIFVCRLNKRDSTVISWISCLKGKPIFEKIQVVHSCW